ncbi:hypothetical protein [Thioalkalivibrio sulfidiphilus]|uniref:hypothetical protein n=1 Tax=Thioalkalivibrio sulfidiphilus TaxID=1033854 RepID=UPI0012DF757A|nr:hypothetical protein [Thioalkalivibrio sulfidiphilus]
MHACDQRADCNRAKTGLTATGTRSPARQTSEDDTRIQRKLCADGMARPMTAESKTAASGRTRSPMKLKLLLKTLPALLAAGFLLTGCGGGDGGSTSSSSGNTGSGTTSTWYMAVRAFNSETEYSPYSNEAAGTLAAGSRVTLAWEAPTRTLDGQCTTVAGYVIEMGTRSGIYSHDVEVINGSNSLTCWATGTDDGCNTTIYTCEAQVQIPSA